MGRETLAELRVLCRGDDLVALRELVRSRADEFAGVTGVGVEQLLVATNGSDRDAHAAARALLDRARCIELESQELRARDRTSDCIATLLSTVRWKEQEAHLDPVLLLRLASVSHHDVLSFEVAGLIVPVRRCNLVRFKGVARRLPGLSAWVDQDALRLRWRSGAGGLDLHARRLTRDELRDALRVVLLRSPRGVDDSDTLGRPTTEAVHGRADASLAPPPPPTPSRPESPSRRPSGAWLGDILAKLGLP